MSKGRPGFTLVELIVATLLSMLVFMGVMSVTTTAIRSHFQEIRNGENNTAEMFGIDQMRTLFGQTSHLEPCYPPPNNSTTSTGLPPVTPGYCPSASIAYYEQVRGCVNYSQSMAQMGGTGKLSATLPTTWYDLCWSPPGGNGPSGYATLFLYQGNNCPVGAWPGITVGPAGNCGSAVGGVTPDAIVLNFYPVGYPTSQPIFTRQPWGGVSMSFSVGIATSDATGTGIAADYRTVAVPKTYQMTAGTGIQESYNAPTCAGGAPCD